MITVQDIYQEIERVLGTCSQEEVFSKINESIEELANLGNWDPMVMYMDICTEGCEITLPDDIEVPLAINVGGNPANFKNKWFEFHLNGPGTECCASTCNYSWSDKGEFPTFRTPLAASTISAFPEGAENLGTTIRVFGYDSNEKWIMTANANGVLEDGFPVSVVYGLGAGVPSTAVVKRITRVSKPVTNSFIRLIANDSASTLLGLFRPSITEPSFRRITVSGAGCNCLCTSSSQCSTTSTWVRMRVRRKVFRVSQLSDPIPLHSITALKMMAQAIKKYEADLITEYGTYFAAARDALQREQKSRSGPNQIKIQFQSSYAGRPGDNMI